MTGDKLEVALDGERVWRGDLGSDAPTFDGPVGLQSDNGQPAREWREARRLGCFLSELSLGSAIDLVTQMKKV